MTLFLPNISQAGTVVGICNGCTEAQKISMIVEHYVDSPSTHKYLVKDFDNRVQSKFNLMVEPEVGMVIPNSVRQTTSERNSFFDQLREWDFIKAQLGQPYSTSLNVTAYDLQLYPFLQSDVINDFENNASVVRRVQDLFSTIVSGTVGRIGLGSPGFKFEIVLADNSKAILQIDSFINNLGNIEYKVIGLKDSDGNEIPMERVVNGRLVFRFHTIENFMNWWGWMQETYDLEEDHVNVTFVGTIIPPEGRVMVTDVVNGEVEPPPPPPEEDEQEP